MTQSVKGYKINFATDTITMNYKFTAAARQYGTPEYNILKAIKADFPYLKEVVEAGRKVKSVRPNKRLTYENMEQHIAAYENAKELLATFERVKALSKPMKSPYCYVREWFLLQFPNYKESPTFQNGKLTVSVIVPPDTASIERKDTDAAA